MMMMKVSERFNFVQSSSPEELEREIMAVRSVLNAAGQVRTPLTEGLTEYLRLLRQARAVA